MKSVRIAAIAVFVTTLALVCLRANAEDERVLFNGFEKDKLLKWTKLARADGDLAHIYLPSDYARRTWTMKKGVSTEGDWSMMISVGVDQAPVLSNDTGFNKSQRTAANSYLRWEPRYSISFSLKPGMLSNLLPDSEFTKAIDATRGKRAESAVHHDCAILYTGYKERFTYSPEAFPRDWQGFSFLRVDVLPEQAELKLRVHLEDDNIFPPITKRFVVPAGKWVTLEIDLDKEVKDRSLDLGKILNFWIFLEETAAPTRIYFDNVRLSAKNVKAKLPVPTGGEKVPAPVADMPPTAKVEPARTPLSLGQPIAVTMKRVPSTAGNFYHQGGNIAPSLRLWAYDNNRMVLDNNGGEFYCTTDGGASWKPIGVNGWVGTPGGTTSDPQGASAMDAHGNIIFVGNYGPCIYHVCPFLESLYSRSFVTASDGWAPSPFYVIPCESRGCTWERRVLALPSGRIWMVSRVKGRLVHNVQAMYSDDSGKTWRGVGVDGKLTNTLADLFVGNSASGSWTWKPLVDPLSLVPYREHVAVIWNDSSRNESKGRGMFWRYFDGKGWSTPEKIDSEFMSFGEVPSKSRRYSTVSVDNRQIFISTDKGVVVWDGTKWTDEAGSPPSMLLSVAGNKLFGVNWSDKTLTFWKRTGPGKWESKELATNQEKVILVAVPPASPPNFVPVAWYCSDKDAKTLRKTAGPGNVSVLRVPVEVK